MSQTINAHLHSGKGSRMFSDPSASRTEHEWCPPQAGDSRSPCPGLNTLANHGYIARDGKNLTIRDLIAGVREAYNVSLPLAAVLACGSFLLLGRVGRVSLHEIGQHGRVEHDASLVHRDTPHGERYAPDEVDEELVRELVGGVEEENGDLMIAADFVRARVRRENASGSRLGWFHEAVACREIAVLLGVFGREFGPEKRLGVPVSWVREWIGRERFPDGWRPVCVVGLVDTERRAREVSSLLELQRGTEVEVV